MYIVLCMYIIAFKIFQSGPNKLYSNHQVSSQIIENLLFINNHILFFYVVHKNLFKLTMNLIQNICSYMNQIKIFLSIHSIDFIGFYSDYYFQEVNTKIFHFIRTILYEHCTLQIM